MTELRQRSTHEDTRVTPQKSDDDEDVVADTTAARDLPQASDKTTEVIDTALKDLTPRWRNWVIRGIFSWLMIFAFSFIIYLGPVALALLVLGIQIKCFHEIINIGHVVYRSYDLPWFRTLSWYFLFASNYFFYGESMAEYVAFLPKGTIPWQFVRYHRFIAFCLYILGFVGFVFSLIKKSYLKQFTLFGWTHVTLLIVVTQSHLIVQNIFEGLVWFLVPVSMVICNDIMAYMFGFFFGKTPLIKLSPKKTWEGFIGGALSTVLFGLLLSWGLCQFDYFVCPLTYSEELDRATMVCERSLEFQLVKYELPSILHSVFSLVRVPWTHISMFPFVWHSISFSIFASVIGPFGGFFASGFKRAFKIKDFGDTIPGHGGIMDRFDCQFLMATFVHVYHSSFITMPNPQKILQSIVALKPEQQLQVFSMLRERLVNHGLLPNITSSL